MKHQLRCWRHVVDEDRQSTAMAEIPTSEVPEAAWFDFATVKTIVHFVDIFSVGLVANLQEVVDLTGEHCCRHPDISVSMEIVDGKSRAWYHTKILGLVREEIKRITKDKLVQRRIKQCLESHRSPGE